MQEQIGAGEGDGTGVGAGAARAGERTEREEWELLLSSAREGISAEAGVLRKQEQKLVQKQE